MCLMQLYSTIHGNDGDDQDGSQTNITSSPAKARPLFDNQRARFPKQTRENTKNMELTSKRNWIDLNAVAGLAKQLFLVPHVARTGKS